MLTTTLELSRQARSTRLIWPACKAPIVGTRPIVWPSTRHPREASSMAAAESKTAGTLAGAVLDLFSPFPRGRNRAVRRVRVLRTRECSRADLLGELLRCLADLLGEVCVALHELWRLARGEPKHVVEDEHLAVGSRSRTDPDGRDAQSSGDPGGQGVGHTLQHEADRPRLLEILCIGKDARRLGLALALDFETPHLVHELWRQPQVAHHGYAQPGQAPRDLNDAAAPLQLHAMHSTLLQEASGARDRLLNGSVIGHERHIANQQGLPGATCDRLGMVNHLVEGHRQRGLIAQHHHPEAVADQKDRNACVVEDLRAQVVVGGEHRKATAFILESLDVQDRCHARDLLRVAATVRVSALLVCAAAAGSKPACWANSSATWPSIR